MSEKESGQGGRSGQEHERVKQERGKSWTLLRIVSKKTAKEGGSWRRNSWRQREGAGRNVTDSVSKGGAPQRRAKTMQPSDQTSEAGL